MCSYYWSSKTKKEFALFFLSKSVLVDCLDFGVWHRFAFMIFCCQSMPKKLKAVWPIKGIYLWIFICLLLFFLRYYTDPSGTFWQCNAKAIGSGSEGADTSLQELFNKVLLNHLNLITRFLTLSFFWYIPILFSIWWGQFRY